MVDPLECCIVSVGIGKWYSRGIDRLNESLDKVGWEGGRLLYKEEYPPDCPSVKSHGYSFKPYALQEARRRRYRLILWADASVWPLSPIDPIFEKISSDGYLFFFNGYSVGEWCRDSALPKLGLNREEAFSIPEITGSFYGLDMSFETSRLFLDQFVSYGLDHEIFADEPRKNDQQQCSADFRVRGHRHDQTAASVIVRRLGFKPTHCPFLYAYYAGKNESTIFVNAGM